MSQFERLVAIQVDAAFPRRLLQLIWEAEHLSVRFLPLMAGAPQVLKAFLLFLWAVSKRLKAVRSVRHMILFSPSFVQPFFKTLRCQLHACDALSMCGITDMSSYIHHEPRSKRWRKHRPIHAGIVGWGIYSNVDNEHFVRKR